MSISKDNVSIKHFLVDEDFKKNKNPHKYILLWSTKFYRLVNRIMRKYSLEDILNETKYTKRFLKKMVKYFFDHGIYKDDIIKKTHTLYRGVDKDFKISPDTSVFIEKGFMSTTLNVSVAENLSGKGGNVISFKTSRLPRNTPFIVIDDKIDEFLQEQEILFLPGTITFKNTSSSIKATYIMNPIFYELLKETSAVAGGGPEKLPYIDLRCKYIIWWRAINGRAPEVVGSMRMPKKKEEVEEFYRDVVLPHDDKFEVKTDFIPEYMDLKERIMTNYKGVSKEDKELYKSYSVHMAVYSTKKKQIITIHYGVFAEMFNEEMFDVKRTKEVEDVIMKWVH